MAWLLLRVSDQGLHCLAFSEVSTKKKMVKQTNQTPHLLEVDLSKELRQKRAVGINVLSDNLKDNRYIFRSVLHPVGSMFFPFRVDSFSDGIWCVGKQ